MTFLGRCENCINGTKVLEPVHHCPTVFSLGQKVFAEKLLSLGADMADCYTLRVRHTSARSRSRNLGLKAYLQISVLSRSQSLSSNIGLVSVSELNISLSLLA